MATRIGSKVISRRAFLGGAAASGAALAVGSTVLGRAGMLTAGAAPVTRYPLFVPPVVDLGGLAKAYRLTAKPSAVDLGGGKLSNAWTYNSFMPGPTLRAKQGDLAKIVLR